ncbi:MAG TPA: hypothetical protein PL110_05490 [Candidatus Eremiobacteraeota bacterium]|nr:MAG: hypothetical protein BWY64_03341 [bacterium ADurb.Bin363]HPZ07545.1 hypothetical protein [Candidatus Eremiobacteraeota bacterium]
MPVKECQGKNGKSRDFGVGSTNEEQKGSQIEAKPVYERQGDNKSDKTEIFVNVYTEERVATNQSDTMVSGKRGEGKTFLSEPVKGAPIEGEGTYKPYEEIYQQYKENSEKTLNKEKIPKGYKAIVRQYFEEIEPGKLNNNGEEVNEP